MLRYSKTLSFFGWPSVGQLCKYSAQCLHVEIIKRVCLLFFPQVSVPVESVKGAFKSKKWDFHPDSPKLGGNPYF